MGVFSQRWEGDVGSGHSGRPGKGCPFWAGALEPDETIYANPAQSLPWALPAFRVTSAAVVWEEDWDGRPGVKSQLFDLRKSMKVCQTE